ncbi:BON association protein 1 [Tripterygium wilfordii]|uniref:BON association protein 1 n=1 Tax=Tripterygium wilfordii TaxID=458696 RepID=A0A7J7CFZ4_TRIWF|nr:BON1-associated protein 2-like [Tripterygium wilfordii]KAF5733012.1 BON association protein 1 [Tripterygium wilfordii]
MKRSTNTTSSSSSRTLEFTVLSGEDLRLDGKPIKKGAFVVVKIDPLNRFTTKIDAEGGSYPYWEDKFVMELPANSRFVTAEVRCKNNGRIVGKATMPVSDIEGEYTPLDYLHFLSYRLRDERGLKNGIVNVSARLKVRGYAGSSLTAAKPEMGLPTYAGGVVTGVPVGYHA